MDPFRVVHWRWKAITTTTPQSLRIYSFTSDMILSVNKAVSILNLPLARRPSTLSAFPFHVYHFSSQVTVVNVDPLLTSFSFSLLSHPSFSQGMFDNQADPFISVSPPFSPFHSLLYPPYPNCHSRSVHTLH